jgi:two-component system, OmpR family, response regulator
MTDPYARCQRLKFDRPHGRGLSITMDYGWMSGASARSSRLWRCGDAAEPAAAGEPSWGTLPRDDHRPPRRILLVDDDTAVQQMVASYLGQHGFLVAAAIGRLEVARQFKAAEPSLVILDLQLRQEDGLDLLREIRIASDVPVVITTGHRRDEIERVLGLELGADDFLTKPFGLRELLARIRAVLRRREMAHAVTQRETWRRSRSRFAGWELDRRLRRLTDPAGVFVALTKGEYALLLAFLDAPRRPLTREHLLQATRIHEDVFDRSIDVQVLRLRRKLESDPSAPQFILTERGVGYVFAMPVETI